LLTEREWYSRAGVFGIYRPGFVVACRGCSPRVVSGFAANALKLSVCRLRPAYFAEHMPVSILDTWIGALPNVFSIRANLGTYFASSFPSGHAATAFGLAIGLSWLYPAGRVPFFTFAALASLQRITNGAHWLSDTLIGVALPWSSQGA
jgi:membrane-associated phospholipid phosphatase